MRRETRRANNTEEQRQHQLLFTSGGEARRGEHSALSTATQQQQQQDEAPHAGHRSEVSLAFAAVSFSVKREAYSQDTIGVSSVLRVRCGSASKQPMVQSRARQDVISSSLLTSCQQFDCSQICEGKFLHFHQTLNSRQNYFFCGNFRPVMNESTCCFHRKALFFFLVDPLLSDYPSPQ